MAIRNFQNERSMGGWVDQSSIYTFIDTPHRYVRDVKRIARGVINDFNFIFFYQ